MPKADWCPWHMYRTSGDINPDFGSCMGNMMTTIVYAEGNLSRPGCWAYADMLEVGVPSKNEKQDPSMTVVEQRSHFGGWAIISSPLILSHNVNDEAVMDSVWPIIANPEAIAVNQGWAGFAGSVYDEFGHNGVHPEVNTLQRPMNGLKFSVGDHFWYKPLEHAGAKTAVLIVNKGDTPNNYTAVFSAIPGVMCTTCHIRDVWNRKDLGTFTTNISFTNLPSHDSAFFLVTPS